MNHLSKVLLLPLLCVFGTLLFASDTSKKTVEESLQPIEVEYNAPDYLYIGITENEYPVPPILKKAKAPHYPPKMKRKKIEGFAEVTYVIEADGSTSHIVATKATNSYFAKAAVNTVKKWKFTPATWQGEAVAIQSRAPLIFKLPK